MLRVITSGARFVEVPVNYLPRVGTSAVTGDLGKAVRLGLQMIVFILRYRLRTLGRPRPRPPARTVGGAVESVWRGGDPLAPRSPGP